MPIKKPVTLAAKPGRGVIKPVIKQTVKTVMKAIPANAAKPKAVMPKPISKAVEKKMVNEY